MIQCNIIFRNIRSFNGIWKIVLHQFFMMRKLAFEIRFQTHVLYLISYYLIIFNFLSSMRRGCSGFWRMFPSTIFCSLQFLINCVLFLSLLNLIRHPITHTRWVGYALFSLTLYPMDGKFSKHSFLIFYHRYFNYLVLMLGIGILFVHNVFRTSQFVTCTLHGILSSIFKFQGKIFDCHEDECNSDHMILLILLFPKHRLVPYQRTQW